MSTRKDYENLTGLGYTGAMSDMKEAWLIDQGYDSINAYLKGQGYTGATSDMIKQLATFNGYASVNEFLRDVGLYGTGSVSFYPLTITQSLRFNDDDSAYLSRTPSVAGNRKTWTWSGWVKRGNIGSYQVLFGAGSSTSNRLCIRLDVDKLYVFEVASGSTVDNVGTNAVFRDPSSWYHVTVTYNSTESTSTDRIKIYVNGELQTSLASTDYPSLNYNGYVNLNASHFIGMSAGSTQYLDGYLAEVHFTDGTAYTADDFGEFKSGVWVAKTPSVTYGTNGFYLDFANSGALGTDSSGNGNTWTPTNLVATDVVLDSPTNNFATFNAIAKRFDDVLSEGNLRHTKSATNWNTYAPSTLGVKSGKFYAEFVLQADDPSQYTIFGVGGFGYNTSSTPYSDADTILFQSDGRVWITSATTGYPNYQVGDVVSVAGDMDNGSVWFRVNNGSWYGASATTGNPETNSNGLSFTAEEMFFVAMSYNSNCVLVANFGQDSSFAGAKTPQGYTDANGIGDFYYEPPTGYLALCTANLPEPAISPLNSVSPADYMNTVLYTGDGSSSHAITGLGFQPDLVWIKNRGSAGENHGVYDVNRSSGSAVLYPNLTLAEADGGYLELDADGFTVNTGNQNVSGYNYVAWTWTGGGTPVTNTDGTITSSVSANTESGFSIVSYTGNLTAAGTATVGHGLSATPDIVITKRRDGVSSWVVRSSALSTWSHNLYLESTAAQSDSSSWGTIAVTDTTFGTNYVTGNNVSGHTHVAYCFHSVEGFSKIGSYVGNGSDDGTFVHCGFSPSLVLIKRTDNVGNWQTYDGARDTYNTHEHVLFPNLSNAEGVSSGYALDTLSNGFKLRSTDSDRNANGGTYIFIAFAEMPFKYSTGR